MAETNIARRFNVTGPCNPTRHYMVDIRDKLKEIKDLIDNGDYFTINRARQYGKRTTIATLVRYLKNEYIVISLDFQTIGESKFRTENIFTKAFVNYLRRVVNNRSEPIEGLDRGIIDQIIESAKADDEFAFDDMFPMLSELCYKAKKPVVLIIDEVDSATNNAVFLDFLAQLRGVYLARTTNNTPTFRSVILAGVHDVKNIKRKLRQEEQHGINNPWNIAAESCSESYGRKEEVEMKEYLKAFTKIFSYPEDACRVLEQAYDKINAEDGTRQNFMNLLNCYEKDMNYDFRQLLLGMEEVSSKADVHKYTGHLLMLICMSETLKEYYRAASVDEKIWFTSMCDLKWKLDECKCVFDIWGTFVASWFDGFFQMNRFGLVRLQFETIPFGEYYEKDGVVLTPDSTVINIHIPRTGTRLDRESLRQSYQAASEFYQDKLGDRPLVFVCRSWLLFPRNKEILDPASNLYAFISDFDIVRQGEYKNYDNVWALFDVNYNGDVEQLPQDTSLRRAYADWIRKGEKTGWGYGVFVYEPNVPCVYKKV